MNKKDIFAILLPVLICIIVFLLPQNWQNTLAFNSLNLNIWSWFTNIFVHQNLTHLLFNIIIYIIVMLTGYFALPKEDKYQFLRFVFILIILSALLIFLFETFFRIFNFIPNVLNQRGFSGISAASLGFLCFVLSRRLQVRMNYPNNLNVLLTFIYYFVLPSLAIIVWNLSKLFSLVIILLWMGIMVLSIINGGKAAKNKTNFNKLSWKEIFLYALIMLILFGGAGLLVPPKIINANGTITDILAHLLGFIAGAVITFVYLLVSKK